MEYTIEDDEISSYSIQEYEEITSEVEKDPTTFKEMYNSYNKANQEIRYGWTDIQSFDDIDKIFTKDNEITSLVRFYIKEKGLKGSIKSIFKPKYKDYGNNY